MKVGDQRFRFLDFDEADRLEASAEPQWKPLMAVALRTGLRLGELLALSWQDVDLRAGQAEAREYPRVLAGDPNNTYKWVTRRPEDDGFRVNLLQGVLAW